MADISKITLPTGSTYNLKDQQARDDISAIQTAIIGGVTFIGETITALTDGSTTTSIIINSQTITAAKGNLVVYNNKEFVFDGTKWIEMGDLNSIGSLGWKDSASTTYTPTGTITVPTISVETAGSTTTVNSITAVGTLPTLTTTVTNETLTIGFDQGTLPTKGANTTVKTGDAAYQATAPTFNGVQTTITVT